MNMQASDIDTTAQLFQSAETNLPGGGLGGYALANDIRLIFSHGRGAKFWDTNGREYIDYTGGAGR